MKHSTIAGISNRENKEGEISSFANMLEMMRNSLNFE